MKQNPYDPSKNPKGILDLGSAINELMLDDLSEWTKRNVKKSQLKDNNQGYLNLPKAAAEFMNEHFRVRLPLTSENILVANGVTTLLDTLTYNIMDEGQTILVPTPSSGIFAHDVWARNGVHVVEVPCDDIPEERFWGPPPENDGPIQTPELVSRLQAAIEAELDQKRTVGGILLANPDDPLGRCYAAHVLLQVSQLCAKHNVHLIVDEIYAVSAGDRFSSILSLGLDVNFKNVYVLWGMCKDFGLGGLGIGFLATYNKKVHDAMRALNMLGGVSSFSATVAEKLLSDSKYLRKHYLPLFLRRLSKRRNIVEEALDDYGIPYEKPEAGFFVLVNLSEWVEVYSQKHGKGGDSAFLELLMKQRVFLEPGEVISSFQTSLLSE
ncbi:1-aminocyclopropane-1-carboxylate synthase-like protein 1 [Colletotrichum spaethianum]|uniref:1-aminocyclopropane-1-carboxylate synthase-like protein 1 n=1 Tax=Colletotrichum spaethianum TaxID=700344 RepID=A0AA37PCE8_9PEZI|nr:1-aminocyclopropane-1-carboxylate synthase-like protein 1 [Colletotrichum spaethianum]GKT49600.1 1-aminocyclopropane-1-carboxylate synthase-like protein 1 [Colletotrichum spaethianum]